MTPYAMIPVCKFHLVIDVQRGCLGKTVVMMKGPEFLQAIKRATFIVLHSPFVKTAHGFLLG